MSYNFYSALCTVDMCRYTAVRVRVHFTGVDNMTIFTRRYFRCTSTCTLVVVSGCMYR